MNIDPAVVIHWLERLGIPIVLVICFIKGWIVPAYVYVQLQESEREFRKITLRNTELANKAITAGERIAEQAKQ